MAFDKNKYIFLLGGHDLEMLEIRKILEGLGLKEGEDFFDRNLEWGAKLSSYKDCFVDKKAIVGIELTKDIDPPKNYIEIDHHNENAKKPSSIEQIALLLGIVLDHRQQLIAANDRGYIPEMLKCCASYSEVMEIRKRDKDAQGMTEDDEKLADKAIKGKIYCQDVLVVESETNRFSAICDKLYPFGKLLIYSKDQLNYYGKNVAKIQKYYKDLIEEKKAYFGGGENGFFGINQGSKTFEEIFQIKEQILMEAGEISSKPFSYHIFLFPFKWDIILNSDDLYSTGFRERTIIDNFQEKYLDNKNWERKFLDPSKSAKEFNVSSYFYDFTEEAVFDQIEINKNEKSKIKESEKPLIQFRFKLDANKEHLYKIFIKDVKNPYVLNVDEILLNIYNTGVGMLSFHLANYEYSHLQDILCINDFGRRTYPQFLDNDTLVEGTKGQFLADRIQISLNNSEFSTNETFCYYSNLDNFKEKIFILPHHIQKLLGEKFTSNKNGNINKVYVNWLIDDRMFVICWYGNSELVNDLQIYSEPEADYKYVNSDFWHQLIFVDHTGASTKSKVFLKALLKKHTYDRWIDSNYAWPNLYGISRYSFLLLTNSSGHFAINHLKSMYFLMVQLCLAQRASILRFSDEVTHISSRISGKNITEKISVINEEYLKFVNQMYFREVTAQEQGIDIYDKIQEVMRIENNVKDLNREIDELYQYANLKEDKERNKKASALNIIAAFFIPATLIAAILGISFINSDDQIIWLSCPKPSVLKALILIIGGGLLTSGLIFLIMYFRSCINFVKKIFKRK